MGGNNSVSVSEDVDIHAGRDREPNIPNQKESCFEKKELGEEVLSICLCLDGKPHD